MQMNVCLSGFAGCFGRVAYPAGVDDAAARIRAARPDAVTVNEACHGDVARIARKAGYHLRFSTVRTAAGPLRCVRPGGRGRFGDAVLTRAPVVASDSHAFAAQAGSERRRWLCVTTRAGVDVCTAHLATRSPVEVAGNEAQCAELATILARRMAARPVIFGGDVNRRRPCAPRRPLDPHRRHRRPGPEPPARLRQPRAPLTRGARRAGHVHRPRRAGDPGAGGVRQRRRPFRSEAGGWQARAADPRRPLRRRG